MVAKQTLRPTGYTDDESIPTMFSVWLPVTGSRCLVLRHQAVPRISRGRPASPLASDRVASLFPALAMPLEVSMLQLNARASFQRSGFPVFS